MTDATTNDASNGAPAEDVDRIARPVIVVLDDWEGGLERLVDWARVAGDADVRVHRAALHADALHDAVAAAHVIVLNRDRTPFDAALLARCHALRYLVFTGQRNGRVDYEALRRRRIPVSGTDGGPGADSTCEQTWTLILAAIRRIDLQSALVADGRWRSREVAPLADVLAGQRLGLVGCGRIGGKVAAVGRAFGMDVVTWSPHMTAERAAAAGATSVPFDELLRTSRVVSLHLVVAAGTRHVIDAQALASMRADALLVNTSRAALIDHVALIDALRARRIAMAALDVFPIEPLPPDDPLRTLDDVLLAPHMGFISEPVFRAFARGVEDALAAWNGGAPLPRLVDSERPTA